ELLVKERALREQARVVERALDDATRGTVDRAADATDVNPLAGAQRLVRVGEDWSQVGARFVPIYAIEEPVRVVVGVGLSGIVGPPPGAGGVLRLRLAGAEVEAEQLLV